MICLDNDFNKIDISHAPFGKVLKQLRGEHGISQSKLADVLGTTTQNIGRYEQGRREPSFDFLIKACDFFDVSADFLLGRTERRSNIMNDMNSVFSYRDIERFNEVVNKYPLEFRKPIFELIADLGLAFEDLDKHINIDKLYVLAKVNIFLDYMRSYEMPSAPEFNDEDVFKAVRSFAAKKSFIYLIFNMLSDYLFGGEDKDGFVFHTAILSEERYPEATVSSIGQE